MGLRGKENRQKRRGTGGKWIKIRVTRPRPSSIYSLKVNQGSIGDSTGEAVTMEEKGERLQALEPSYRAQNRPR